MCMYACMYACMVSNLLYHSVCYDMDVSTYVCMYALNACMVSNLLYHNVCYYIDVSTYVCMCVYVCMYGFQFVVSQRVLRY